MFIQQVLNGLVVGGVYALFALGFSLVFGIHHILNLAHGAVFMTGAFVALYAVLAGLPLWVGFIMAIFAAGIVSVIIEFTAFRPLRKSGESEFGAIISSIGANLVIISIAQRVSNTEVLRFPFETFPIQIFKFAGLRVSLLQLFMSVMVTEWRFAPGAATGWHRHEFDYVITPVMIVDKQFALQVIHFVLEANSVHAIQIFLNRISVRVHGLDADFFRAADFRVNSRYRQTALFAGFTTRAFEDPGRRHRVRLPGHIPQQVRRSRAPGRG